MATNKRKLRRNDVKRSNIDLSVAENAKLEKENIRYQNKSYEKKEEYTNNDGINVYKWNTGNIAVEPGRAKQLKQRHNRSNAVTQSQTQMNKAQRIENRKKEFRKKAFLSLSTTLSVLGMAVVLFWYFSFDNLDLKKYVTVSYDGYDTHGTAYPHINALGKYSMFLGMLNCQIKPVDNAENGELKNGDSIIIDIDYDKEIAREWKLRVKNAEIETEVTGLSDGQTITLDQLFEQVKVTYEGTAPELTITVTNESTKDYPKDIQFEIVDPKAFYDYDDSFQVKANITKEDAVKNGYDIEEGKNGYLKEYTVENVDRYFRNVSDVTLEQIQELNQEGAKLFGDAKEYGLRIFSEANLMPIWVNNKTTFTWSNPRLQSVYFNVLKEECFGRPEVHDNDIKLVYLVTLKQADGVSCETQVVVRFTDLMKRADGTIDLALDSGKIIAASYHRSNIKELVNDAYNEDYESTEIEL